MSTWFAHDPVYGAYWIVSDPTSAGVPPVPPTPPSVFGDSGSGGSSSWERKEKWNDFTYERSKRHQELFERFLKTQLALDSARQALAERDESRLVKAATRKLVDTLEYKRASLSARIAKLEALEEKEKIDEECLLMAIIGSLA